MTFDLIGLPPTPADVDAFLQDASPNAYEKVVDRLLADPRFGEKWARHWLDTAGYADSEGILQEDRIRANAWRYRDYVIRSFNSDKPYDRFVREQIAGDELVDYHGAPKWTPEIEEAITATGFLRNAVDATRDDFNPHQFSEYQVRMLNDTQTILVSSTLGVTLQCARCHDHKLEPFTQRDYYRMQAFLTPAIRPDGKLLPTNRRQILAGTDLEHQRAKKVNADVDAALQASASKEAALLADYRIRHLAGTALSIPEADRKAVSDSAAVAEAKRTPEQKALAAKYKALIEVDAETLSKEYPEFKTRIAELRGARAEEEKKRITLPEIRAFYDQDNTPPPTSIRIRGEWTRPGDAVEPGVPAVLDDPRSPFRLAPPPLSAKTTGRRLALAEWITRADNPLTARAIVNRVWERHFGEGLVPTSENLGVSGAKPSNQALLDWLACSLVRGFEGGAPWTLKAMHRLMVTSIAYRQVSTLHPSMRASTAQASLRPKPNSLRPAPPLRDAAGIDANNRLLWRQRPRRLEAENIRDAVLFAAGSLDSTMFGEPVGEVTKSTGEISPVAEEKQGRRSIYLLVRRSMPVTLLNTFDAPIMETNCTRRISSATATQALAILNSAFLDSQARTFAIRVRKESSGAAAGQPARDVNAIRIQSIDTAYRIALSRKPNLSERTAALDFLRMQSARYAVGAKSEIAGADEKALADFCLALLGSNEFMYVD